MALPPSHESIGGRRQFVCQVVRITYIMLVNEDRGIIMHDIHRRRNGHPVVDAIRIASRPKK
jgi:hypothetical protein